jgi:hypothetical protein
VIATRRYFAFGPEAVINWNPGTLNLYGNADDAAQMVNACVKQRFPRGTCSLKGSVHDPSASVMSRRTGTMTSRPKLIARADSTVSRFDVFSLLRAGPCVERLGQATSQRHRRNFWPLSRLTRARDGKKIGRAGDNREFDALRRGLVTKEKAPGGGSFLCRMAITSYVPFLSWISSRSSLI